MSIAQAQSAWLSEFQCLALGVEKQRFWFFLEVHILVDNWSCCCLWSTPDGWCFLCLHPHRACTHRAWEHLWFSLTLICSGFLSEQLQKMPDHILMLQNLGRPVADRCAAVNRTIRWLFVLNIFWLDFSHQPASYDSIHHSYFMISSWRCGIPLWTRMLLTVHQVPIMEAGLGLLSGTQNAW